MMMLAPSNKDTRTHRNEMAAATQRTAAVSLPAATSLANFDPFVLEEDKIIGSRGKSQTRDAKSGKKQKANASKKKDAAPEDNNKSPQAPRRAKKSNMSSTGRASSNRRLSTKEDPAKPPGLIKKSSRGRGDLESKSEHVQKRASSSKLKEKRRAASSRNLKDNSMKNESSRKDSNMKNESSRKDRSPVPKKDRSRMSSKKGDPLSLDSSKNGPRPSVTKRASQIKRHKSTPHNPASLEKITMEARPKLVRSNSLDSRLDDLDKAEEKKKTSAEAKSTKKRVSMSHKKALSNRALLAKANSTRRIKKKDTLALNGNVPSASAPKRSKLRISRAKSTAGNITDVTDKDATRPVLARSNSLDSKMDDLGADEINPASQISSKRGIREQQRASLASKRRSVLTTKRAKSKHSIMDKKGNMDPLGANSDHVSSTSKFRINRAKPTASNTPNNTGKGSRPGFVRSNSLDSKMDDLGADEDDPEPQTLSKRDVREQQRASNANKRRSALATKRLSSRGNNVDRKESKDLLGANSDHVAMARRGRGSRRSSLGEPLSGGGLEGGLKRCTTTPAVAMRSNSVDIRLDAAPEKEAVTTNPPGGARANNMRRSMMGSGGNNHALKMFMDRTTQEETAAETLKSSQLEKLSNIQKNFQNIAREQSKFTGSVMARKSALSLVPSLSIRDLHGNNTSKATAPAAYGFKTASLSSGPAPGINDMAQRMKDLGTSFRLSKKQLMVDTKGQVQKSSGEIPLLLD